MEYWKWIHGYMIKSIMLYDGTDSFLSATGGTTCAYGLRNESRYEDQGWGRVIYNWHVYYIFLLFIHDH
jgi:hypothetical protein